MIAARSPVARMGIEAVTPVAVVVALWLLFAGHNRPGGGFAAGLVLGAVIALRRLAGIAVPGSPITTLGVGTAIAVLVAAAPLVVGAGPLDQQVVTIDVPALGQVKSGTALAFDVGVTTVVVGLVSGVLEGLGDGGSEPEVTP